MNNTMERVLPKESEREVQLRLEAEAEDRRNIEADEIFADKPIQRRGILAFVK